MSDFLKWLTLCVAVLAMTYLLNDHESRISKLEVSGASCPAHCRPIQTLLKNRPYPPPPGVKHSFARPFDICEP